MKYFITIIVLFLCNQFAHSTYWEASKEVPYEIRALISSINLEYMTSEEKLQLKSSIESLDSLISKIPQSDRYFLGKVSLYKWILQNSSTMATTGNFNLNQVVEKKEYEGLSSFAKWLLIAIKSDIIEISKSPEYQRYFAEKIKGKFTKATQTIRKKVKLIAPWAKLVSQSSHQQINLQLMRFQIELLEDLLEQYKIYFHFNGLELPATNDKLAFFKLNSSKKPIKNDKQDSSLSFLDALIEKHKKEGLPLPKNDWTINSQDAWTPGEDSEISIKVERDGSYIAPNKLPEPVDDWVLDY